ncbi:MAG TPA: hypothetical protein VI976_02775, partial [Candidatus Omnitrophota bacterium]|nr:hypothetical protein [Candidatus Omnitrophota bacterium]
APTAGKRYNLKEITLAINIIKEFKDNKALREYRIKKIDVSSLSEAAIYLSLPEVLEPAKEGLILQEVRLGQSNIRAKLMILSGLITQLEDELAKIKYIDLRFKDPVIKYKDKDV